MILAAHLLLTLVSGMALKLYDATPGQDEYQKAGFGAVLIAELRDMQQGVNQVLTIAQEYTGDPKTDSSLGRVGR